MEAFYSNLTHSNICDEYSEHAQNVWRTFYLRTMRDYHNLYMMSMLHPFPPHIPFIQYDS